MEVLLLGTSCMFPTKDRNQPCLLLIRDGNYLLFDAGEGVQRQLRLARVSPMKINNIFITHWHGDHSLGLAGMIQSMSGNKRSAELHVYGPKGTADKVDHLLSAFDFNKTFKVITHEFDLRIGESRDVLKTNNYMITAMRVKHGVNCLNYSLKEEGVRKVNLSYVKKFGLSKSPLLGRLQKGFDINYNDKLIKAGEATYLKPGKKFTYVVDTSLFDELIKFAEGSDLLVCESTYASDKEDKAEGYNHLIARQAGELASRAGVKKLVLTHFSQRYKTAEPMLKEAKKAFKKTFAGRDFMRIKF